MIVDEFRAILARDTLPRLTDLGERFETDCLYPSLAPVAVFVSRLGTQYRVSDGGGAVTLAFRNGRDDAAIQAGLKRASQYHSLEVVDGVLAAEAVDADWLPAAVRAVANASAMAATIAVEHVNHVAENNLKQELRQELEQTLPVHAIKKDFEFIGVRGKKMKAHFAVFRGSKPIILNALVQHHVSVNSNFVLFSQIGDGEAVGRFAVYARALNDDDQALVQQVAELVPLTAVRAGVRRLLGDAYA